VANSIPSDGLIGDLRTGALIDRFGTVAWWCAPRFDSGAIFASLVGDSDNGYWHLGPRGQAHARRAYRGESLVLETIFQQTSGSAALLDFMPLNCPAPTIVRIVEGLTGNVDFELNLVPRMHYGLLTPPSTGTSDEWSAAIGADAVRLRSDVPLTDEVGSCSATFTVRAGQRARFVLQWFPSHAGAPVPCDADDALDETIAWWRAWSSGIRYAGPWREHVVRSAITLKALSDRATGGTVAALTTSLPEQVGGGKNWDYRYCWLRDASFANASLVRLGLTDEPRAFRDWFMRAYGGDPAHLHIMYGIAGERLAPEYTLPWLSGYKQSRPVRVGNGAHDQFQLGVLGHVLRSFADSAKAGVAFDESHWKLLAPISKYIETSWRAPGNGIWETRGERRQYVDSKVMAWVTLQKLDELAVACGAVGEAGRHRVLMAEIREEIERAGYDPHRRTFTQYYGSQELDASTLLMSIVDFLPAGDPRMQASVAAIRRELVRDGFVYRYSADVSNHDAEQFEGEGAFTMCGFWLVQALARDGQLATAAELFCRLIGTANDVGLLSEEFDVARREPIGNLPQAFSHCGLIDAAVCLTAALEREDDASLPVGTVRDWFAARDDADDGDTNEAGNWRRHDQTGEIEQAC
jgi:GH15 family glucan-1,4-alpha-glucosidase